MYARVIKHDEIFGNFVAEFKILGVSTYVCMIWCILHFTSTNFVVMLSYLIINYYP